MKKIILLLSSLVLVACSATSAPTPTPSDLRNYYYSGMASDCSLLKTVEVCAAEINEYIQARDYENLPVTPEKSSDSFYLGMLDHCLKSNTLDACRSITDQAIKNDYFGQLGKPSVFPTPSGA